MALTSQNFQLCESVQDELNGCGKGAIVTVGVWVVRNPREYRRVYSREQPEINDLKIISTEAGDDNWGLVRLYEKKKIKKKCDLPITGAKRVHTTATDLAVFDVDHEKELTLRKYNPKSSIDEIHEKTAADFEVGKEDCKQWKV